jgi:DNA modification methylase
MNGERAILFATDPPYLVDYDGSNHPTRNKDWSASYGTTWDDSSQGAELYDGFIAAAVAEAIAEDAAWYCWHASRRQAMLEACWEKAGAFVHQQIIWVKDRGVLTRSHYLWKHEPCFMGWRRPNRPPKVAEETLPSTWALPSFAKDDRPDHPTPKPLDAFGIPMRQHVARGGLCYEPFSGSGSQIMAGEANGRRVFAMEISPAYVDVAVERWQAETGRDAILDGDGRTFAQVRPSGWALFGLHTTLAQNLKMGAVFTVVSIARSFALRRVFEASPNDMRGCMSAVDWYHTAVEPHIRPVTLCRCSASSISSAARPRRRHSITRCVRPGCIRFSCPSL